MFEDKHVDFHFYVYIFIFIFNNTFTLQVAKMFANKKVDFHVYTSVSIFNITLTLQVAKMFARADKNGDGKLDKEEWHRVLNSAGCRTSM